MKQDVDALAASFAAAAITGAATVNSRAVTDPKVLLRESVFSEARRQTSPLAGAHTPEAREIAKVVMKDTARARGLTVKVAMQRVAEGRSMSSLISGANPKGTMAEVVAAHDYRKLHNAEPTKIVNPPKYVASNVVDIRLSPDHSAKKDLIFGFQTNDGRVLFKHNGQVKNGGTQYVVDTLADMASKTDYGKVGYVDAKLVNADGSPKVGPAAFTEAQAQKLKAAKVRLRGIPDMEQRAKALEQDIRAAGKDGLTPKARQEIETLRVDIAKAYRLGGVARRMGGASAAAAASAAVISLVVQLATEGKVEVTALGQAAGIGAAVAAASTAVDAGLYHAGTRLLGMAPEAAKEVAGQTLAAGFCLFAVGADLVAEAKALKNGEISVESAIASGSVKTAIDVLPLVMAPLGLVGLPILVIVQMCGRHLVAKARASDGSLQFAIDENLKVAADLEARVDNFSVQLTEIEAECDETDRLFAQTLGLSSPVATESMNTPKLNVRLVAA